MIIIQVGIPLAFGRANSNVIRNDEGRDSGEPEWVLVVAHNLWVRTLPY